MNDSSFPPAGAQNPEGAPVWSSFWPLSLLALTLLFLLSWQCATNWKQKAALQVQRVQREELVRQSRAVQSSLQKLMEDLLDLSRTDLEAKALVDKYKVSRR
jgi:hypothetical protein